MYTGVIRIANMFGVRSKVTFLGFAAIPFFFIQFISVTFIRSDDKNQAFFKAVQVADISELRLLLKNGVDPNSKDEIGQTALMHACTKGYSDVITLLLKNGADVNVKDDVGGTALMYAGLGGHEDLVGLLLDKAADFKVRDMQRNTVLIRVAARGHEGVAKLLLEKGANVNAKGAYGMTPLMWVVSEADIEFAQLLLSYGADVNATAKNGITALMFAAGPVYIEEKGQYGSTASVSTIGGDEKIVKLLLDNGADVNAKDVNGNTAMFYAIQKGDDRIKSLLRTYAVK
jgi:ankyrin repeat protein